MANIFSPEGLLERTVEILTGQGEKPRPGEKASIALLLRGVASGEILLGEEAEEEEPKQKPNGKKRGTRPPAADKELDGDSQLIVELLDARRDESFTLADIVKHIGKPMTDHHLSEVRRRARLLEAAGKAKIISIPRVGGGRPSIKITRGAD